MAFLLPEIVLLIGFLFILSQVKKNFFISAAGAAYAAWFGFTQIDHTGKYAYLLSGMFILIVCAFGYSFFFSFENNK